MIYELYHNIKRFTTKNAREGFQSKWMYQDAFENHAVNLREKFSGKVIFSYPTIKFGTAVYYDFANAGVYTYSDPLSQSVTGQITVFN